MTSKPKSPARARRQPRFAPAPTRPRHDGWTPERQVAFVEALAASACVEEACRHVGLTTGSAYRLRARPDAQAFRLAWDAALDYGIRRLSDAVIARALHGERVPHYYQGEQVGEHRRYDNRLAMFLLRYRDPLRYAAALDRTSYSGFPEIAALRLARLSAQVGSGAEAFDAGAVFGQPWREAPVPSNADLRAEAAHLAQRRAATDPADIDAQFAAFEAEILKVVADYKAAEEKAAAAVPVAGEGDTPG